MTDISNTLSSKNVFNRFFMKNLILVRHAKSSWEYDVIDHERPLKTRGINDANLIASRFDRKLLNIDLVLVSDAMRTKLTSEIFINILNIDAEIVKQSHDLYDFSGEYLTRVIKNIEDNVGNVMIFGHNYAITNFVNTYGSLYFDNVPTSGLVWIEFSTNKWCDINKGNTKFHLFPKDFK